MDHSTSTNEGQGNAPRVPSDITWTGVDPGLFTRISRMHFDALDGDKDGLITAMDYAAGLKISLNEAVQHFANAGPAQTDCCPPLPPATQTGR